MMSSDYGPVGLLGKLGDMFLLNILYLACCMPVVTIGAATTALYYTTLKMAENKEYHIAEDFFRSFRENLRQATVIWLLLLAVTALLAMDLMLTGALGRGLGAVVGAVAAAVGMFLIMTGVYVFPLLARFDNTVFHTIKNAAMMSVRHLPSTILIVVIHGLPLLLALASIQALVNGIWGVLLFTVSILAYMESMFFKRIFVKYYPEGNKSV